MQFKSRNFLIIISEGYRTKIWGKFEIKRAQVEKFSNKLQKITFSEKGTRKEEFTLEEFVKCPNDITVIEWCDNANTNDWHKLRLTFTTDY